MNRSIRSLRTHLVGGAVAGVAATLCFVTPADAASLSGGTLSISGAGDVDTANCTITPAPAPPAPATFGDGQTVTQSMSADQTATATADATDVVTFHSSASSTVRSTVSGGDVSTLSVTGTTRASYSATNPDTACGHGTSILEDTADFDAVTDLHRTRAAWMHLEASATGTGMKEAAVILTPSGATVPTLSFAATVSARDVVKDEWIYVLPGDYNIQMAVSGQASDALPVSSSTVKGSIKLTFVKPGTAEAAEAGTAKPMVTLPGALTCNTGKASVKLTSKIAGASNASVYVNGSKKLSVNHPTPKTVSVAVPTDRTVTIKAVVKKSGKSTSATRVYRSC